jgi:hypothetical protein
MVTYFPSDPTKINKGVNALVFAPAIQSDKNDKASIKMPLFENSGVFIAHTHSGNRSNIEQISSKWQHKFSMQS